jgi:energy-converting hydrogenase Eha subunit E
MADITLKLIWYRLSLTYSKMASAASTWYTDLDFDSYVLDLLLLGWVSLAAMVYVCINSIKNALGPVVKQPLAERVRETQPAEGTLASVFARVTHGEQHGETCNWFNAAVGWLYLHYYHTPVYLDDWIKALNVQLSKLGVCNIFFLSSVSLTHLL